MPTCLACTEVYCPMNGTDAAARVLKLLRQLINDYRYHYHVLGESTMSEAAADAGSTNYLFESEFPDLITPDSPYAARG